MSAVCTKPDFAISQFEITAQPGRRCYRPSFSLVPVALSSLRFRAQLTPGRTHNTRPSIIIDHRLREHRICMSNPHSRTETQLLETSRPEICLSQRVHSRSHINFALFFANGRRRRECAIFGSSYSTQLCVLQRR